MSNTLKVKRVPYGKENTPLKDREYQHTFGGLVGNSENWKVCAKEYGYDKVEFKELDGKIWSQYVFEGKKVQK